MWKKCTTFCTDSLQRCWQLLSSRILGFCLHSSHITGMWKSVLFFFFLSLFFSFWQEQRRHDDVNYHGGHAESMQNTRLLPDVIGFCILVLFLLKQFCYCQELFQYMLLHTTLITECSQFI